MADLRNFADWDPGVKRVVQIVGSGPGPEAVFDVAISSVGRDLTLRYVTREYDAPRLVLAEARSRLLTSLDRISISPDPASAGCLVTYDADLRLNGPLGVADFMLRPVFTRIAERAVRGLCAALDGETVAP